MTPLALMGRLDVNITAFNNVINLLLYEHGQKLMDIIKVEADAEFMAGLLKLGFYHSTLVVFI